MLVAITRDVSPGIGSCELTYLARADIDPQLARAQHRRYERALQDLGCRIVALPAEPDLPDSVFVEDMAVVLDELAVVTRPGAESRRPEADSVARALGGHRALARITAPGTLDGGDVLRVGRNIFVGLTSRSNRAGIEQLGALVAEHGYRVKAVEVGGCLHLKSAVTQVAPGALLVNPAWVEPSLFPGLELVEVAEEEPHAANALLVGEGIIYPASFPRTVERLVRRGAAVTTVDMSELQKAEGAVTCCSLVFASRDEASLSPP